MARISLKLWVKEANGWQRIWFVCSVICFLYFIVIYPVSETNKGSSFRYEMKWATERAIKNPNCARYMTDDFMKLVEPEHSTDGSTCYQIYLHRQFSKGNASLTYESFQQDFKSGERERWLNYMVIGALTFAFISGFFYGVGLVVRWVIKGFKN